jgi:uncharacterized membrane protein (UPF0127 family)
MRLKGIYAAIMCASVVAVAVPAGAASTTVTLTIAKTQKRIYAYGDVSPPRPDRSVRIKLSRDTGSGFAAVAAKRFTLAETRDRDGDGVRESPFEVTFPRPSDGTCRVVVTYRSPSGSRRSDASEFPCGIPDFGTGTATIASDSGMTSVDLLIAETGEQQGYGLMYRRWLAPDKGMAFLFAQDTTTSFFMGNTLIPLSIAFFDSAGVIVRILDMEPCEESSCPHYDPGTSYRGALEVNQGAFEEWGVTEGDIVQVTRD